MSHPYDPYRRPESAPEPVPERQEAAASPAAVVPRPITWARREELTGRHPWLAPDPFPPPAGRPAPPAPILESDAKRPPNTPLSPDEAPPSPPSLPQPPVDAEPEQEAAPVVAFPDPVPPPPAQPGRGPAPTPPPQQQPPAEPAADDEEALTIGRGKNNSIVLDDMLVSRHHVRITADDEGLVLQDLGSRNGTYVNGERVERTALHEGDRLGVGATTFEVRDGWLVSL